MHPVVEEETLLRDAFEHVSDREALAGDGQPLDCFTVYVRLVFQVNEADFSLCVAQPDESASNHGESQVLLLVYIHNSCLARLDSGGLERIERHLLADWQLGTTVSILRIIFRSAKHVLLLLLLAEKDDDKRTVEVI